MLRAATLIVVLAATALSCSDAHAIFGFRRGRCSRTCCAPAAIVVTIPDGAKVFISEVLMAQSSTTQTYCTPPLEVGCDYTYSVKIETGTDGDIQTETRTITVRACCTTQVDFTDSESMSDLPKLKDLPKLPEAFFPTVEP
jgi:uncharacterized protein (TIGR03000 family)